MKRQVLALIALLAALALAACGGDDGNEGAQEPTGRTLVGETQSGMQLRVETSVSPGSDPMLARVDQYRQAVGGADGTYLRVTADNTDGPVPDLAPTVTFAADRDALAAGEAVEAAYVCELLDFVWAPTTAQTRREHKGLLEELCTGAPPQRQVRPGSSVTYYLFVEEGFVSRDLESQAVFGPLDAELQPE